MSNIAVRPARPEDKPRIVEISGQIWEETTTAVRVGKVDASAGVPF